jgi:S-adenosylmethionine:tRNA ribosyltransferase-isomerase
MPAVKERVTLTTAKQARPTDLQLVTTFPGIETFDFQLPAELEASEPAEARGLSRDQVRLMVSYRADGRIEHSDFRHLPDFLEAGDLLVINTSGTLNAALEASRTDGTQLELHLSTHLPADLWSVELRQPAQPGSLPFYRARAGESLALPHGGEAILLTPYRPDQRRRPWSTRQQADHPKVRLWIAQLNLPLPLDEYLERFGFPIRYKYVRAAWPNVYYQNVYATEAGSAEMPSAGRAFTPEIITRLVAKGIQVVPLVLNTGVASLESHEPPYEESYRVPAETARAVNAAHAAGKQVVAVGTTVVRALETVTGTDRITLSGEGWTSLVITPRRGLRAVDGLLTGLHEPRSTHLAMLEALAGAAHIRKTYAAALQQGYLWHEFGDLHLILP